MRSAFALLAACSVSLGIVALGACGSEETSAQGDDADAAGAEGGGRPDPDPTRPDPDPTRPDPTRPDPDPDPDPKPGQDPDASPTGPEDAGPPSARIYAHTPRELYVFDPVTKTLTEIGTLGCLGDDVLVDIAVDAKGAVYGTTANGLVAIDPKDGTCTYVNESIGAYVIALTFLPAGMLDPDEEVLVGYTGSTSSPQYVRIDVATGEVTSLGPLQEPDASVRYWPAGDLLALVRNGSSKTYLTVQRYNSGVTAVLNEFAEIDPVTGRMVTVIGPTGHPDLWGLAQWAGVVYGFSLKGHVVEVDLATGSTTALPTATKPDASVLPWFGAGVTTTAPTD